MKYILNITLMLILLSVAARAKTGKKEIPLKKNVVFEVVLDKEIKNKPFLLVYFKGVNFGDASYLGQKEIYPIYSKKNSFVFEIKDQSKPLYFSLLLADSMMNLTVAREYHFEPGDHIRIDVRKTAVLHIYDLDFSGRGSAKYRCKNEFVYAMRTDTVKTMPNFTKDNKYHLNNQNLRYIDLLYDLIEKYQPEMSDYSYNLLHADVLGEMGKHLFAGLESVLQEKLIKKDTVGFMELSKNFSDDNKFDFAKNIPRSVLLDSKEYSQFIMARIRAQVVISKRELDVNEIYSNIKILPDDALRNKMIICFFRQFWGRINNNYDEIIINALSIVKDKKCLDILKTFNRQNEGQLAYNFSLTDINGKIVRLTDFKGKIVFIDFWFTGCSFCEDYYKVHLASVEKKYEDNPNVVFITVSLDKNKAEWLSSVNSGQYTSLKVINLYTNGEGLKNEVVKYYNIFTCPRPMLIGRKGEIIMFTGTKLRKSKFLISEIDKVLKGS